MFDFVMYSDTWAEEMKNAPEKETVKRYENNPIAKEFRRQCDVLLEQHKMNRTNSLLSLFISESLK